MSVFPFLLADFDRNVILVADVRICDLFVCGVIVQELAIRGCGLLLFVQMIC